MPKTNPAILAALRKKLGDVSHQAIAQRRAKIQALVPMPVDIATYVVASREGVALHRDLDASTLEQVANFDARLRAREQANGQEPEVPRRARTKRNPGTTVRQLKIGTFAVPTGTLNPQHTTDAIRMAEVYPLLYTFENSMREYIDGHLTAAHGDGWNEDPRIVSTGIKGRVERNRSAEAKHRYHSRRNARFIYYTDLGDLPTIAHSENGWKVFSVLFPTDKWLHGRVEVIEASRNVVAHMNPLQKRDIDRIRINFEDWLDQIKNTLPS